MFVGILTLIVAIALSSFAALVSIVGMVAIFPAGGMTIIGLMAALETAKVVTAGWLHANWNNSGVGRALKGYLTAAILIIMAITSLGIYGFLARSHLDQKAPLAEVEIQIDRIETRIARVERERSQAEARLKQLDDSIQVFFDEGFATRGLEAREAQSQERSEIQEAIDDADSRIADLQEELVPLRQEINDVSAKLGPLQYLANLLNLTDPSAAVQIVIFMLMVAFDPLAIALVIAASITIKQASKKRAKVEVSNEPRVTTLRVKPVTETPSSEPLRRRAPQKAPTKKQKAKRTSPPNVEPDADPGLGSKHSKQAERPKQPSFAPGIERVVPSVEHLVKPSDSQAEEKETAQTGDPTSPTSPTK